MNIFLQRESLKNSGPFILFLPLRYGVSHSVVVTGSTEKQVIYNDPLTGSHKMMSIDVLNGLFNEHSEQVEIATNRVVNIDNISSKIKTTPPKSPLNIIPKDYQEFFSLDKMDNPRDAVLNFLDDYSKCSLWSFGRHHRKQIGHFVETNKGKELNELLLDLNKTFPKDALNSKGELFKRLLTIEKMLNNNPTHQSETPSLQQKN